MVWRKFFVVLVGVFFFFPHKSQAGGDGLTPAVSSYWEFKNSLLYRSFTSKQNKESFSHLAFKTALSYGKVFSFMTLHADFSLFLGPYTSLVNRGQKIPLNFLGFGGSLGVSRSLDFIPLLKNFSLSGGLSLDQMKSMGGEEKAIQHSANGNLLKAGELYDYDLRVRSLNLDFGVTYHLFRPFEEVLRTDPGSKSYGHAFSLTLMIPVYSSWKKNYYESVAPGRFKERKTSEKGAGLSFALSYQLAFL